ncbi:MAG TPA: prepilin-type N-terminal cleavage/methylation domain-containing protein [Candidatus Elarobacter sp.]
MTDSSTARDDGFTLIEIVIAVAIVATTVAAGFGISLASRSLAVSTAATEFDQFLDSARTMARDLDGATLAFVPDAFGDGTEVRLHAGGPNGPPTPTTLPTLHTRATIEETESLGKAPFAFIVHANGSLSGRPRYRVGDTEKIDVGCPASGAFHFVIQAAGGRADRFVPCRTKLAASGPVTLTAWPLAPSAPSPTPCSGYGCTAGALPDVPASTASCPPNFAPISGGCTPTASSGSGARYHVTITGAPATIGIGATGSFTAQATLTNANAVPPGTPASIPISVATADATCNAAPPGWQSSGSAFSVTGIAAGNCTVTVQADPSAITGAATDSAAATITIGAAPAATPSPSPPPCDLVANGKCYRRIVDQTTKRFEKTVSPSSTCDISPWTNPCTYLDSIRSISLDEYRLTPPAPPVDDEHELLFRIERIDTIVHGCIPYSWFSTMATSDPLPFTSLTVGGPANRPVGFGRPSIYSAVNYVFVASVPNWFDEKTASAAVVPTLKDMIDDLDRVKPGLPYSFTFHSAGTPPNSEITWLPDFPSCDNAGDSLTVGNKFGTVSVDLTFTVFQGTQ